MAETSKTKTKRRGRPKKSAAKTKRRAQRRANKTILDICIPVFGEWDFAVNCINAIEAAAEGMEGQYKIVVIDNGTPEWKPEGAEEQGPSRTPEEQSAETKALLRPGDVFNRLEENAGYPGGINTAVSKGASPFILVLTPDVTLEPGSIPTMLKEFDNEQVGVVGPLLLFPKEESPHGPPGGVQSAGMAFNIAGDPYHIFIGWTPQNPRVNQKREVQAVTGACFMTRRMLWTNIGGMSGAYTLGTYEDVEYCFAVRSMGFRVVFTPEAVGSHYVGASIKHGANKQGFPLMVNQTIFKGRWASALEWDEYRYY